MQHSPLRLLVAGEFAVSGFFVLSGHVLVHRYMQKKDSSILISGLIRRFPRLFIPSTISLLFYYSILHYRPWYGFNECHEIGEGTVEVNQTNLGYALVNTVGQYLWMPALYTIQWTMQVEFICSIVVYALAFLLTQRLVYRVRMFIYAVIALLLPIIWLATNGAIPKMVLYIQPFIFGILLSDLDANALLNPWRAMETGTRTQRVWFSLITICLLVFAIYFGSYPVFNTDVINGSGTIWAPLGWMFGWLWISVGGSCLLLAVLTSSHIQRMLTLKPVHFLGKVSFGVYLIHYIVLCALDATFIQWTARYIDRDVALVLALIFLAVPITLITAYIFHVFVDVPSIQLSYWMFLGLHTGCWKLNFINTKRTWISTATQRRMWIFLLCVLLLLIVVSAIPGSGSSCPLSFINGNTTTIPSLPKA
ncbi:unnamed protein product [Didymodactylos carnosus]|uniref:Acyltransferase 3 domain-containing protein n=1 Tax=Didymodactylos carnosus TaxID=1234261 RepID=A0A815HAW3_9BILA|nr:unnamed protein product [Didymodactylos carnosus]CAF4218608.1 unnamed protein product [Didymodactylos carnosus]